MRLLAPAPAVWVALLSTACGKTPPEALLIADVRGEGGSGGSDASLPLDASRPDLGGLDGGGPDLGGLDGGGGPDLGGLDGGAADLGPADLGAPSCELGATLGVEVEPLVAFVGPVRLESLDPLRFRASGQVRPVTVRLSGDVPRPALRVGARYVLSVDPEPGGGGVFVGLTSPDDEPLLFAWALSSLTVEGLSYRGESCGRDRCGELERQILELVTPDGGQLVIPPGTRARYEGLTFLNGRSFAYPFGSPCAIPLQRFEGAAVAD